METAEKLAARFTGGYALGLRSAEEFHKSFKDRLEKLKPGDVTVLESL